MQVVASVVAHKILEMDDAVAGNDWYAGRGAFRLT